MDQLPKVCDFCFSLILIWRLVLSDTGSPFSMIQFHFQMNQNNHSFEKRACQILFTDRLCQLFKVQGSLFF